MIHIKSYDPLIDAALAEDLGVGDVTTTSIVNRSQRGIAQVITREPLTVAGLPLFTRVFQRLDPKVNVVDGTLDGSQLQTGNTLVRLEGPMVSLLIGERVALNFLQRLCGVATLTQKYVTAVPSECTMKVLDTRKTTPGLRRLERYAVRCGGGRNHRARLDGGILIKDNHIASAGSITSAVEGARDAQGPSLRIEVEVTTLEELDEALVAGAEVVMLDNMSLEEVASAQKLISGRVLVEVSGTVALSSVPQLAKLGVDFISVGALTHSAPAIDLSMKVERC